MTVYLVNSPEQAIAIDKAKNCGCEVIQVSNGILVKTSMKLEELQKELNGASVEVLDLSNPDLSKDARLFAGV